MHAHLCVKMKEEQFWRNYYLHTRVARVLSCAVSEQNLTTSRCSQLEIGLHPLDDLYFLQSTVEDVPEAPTMKGANNFEPASSLTHL
jgi:hypothetical protein